MQRPPLAFALVLAVGVVLTLVGVGVSVRWSGRGGAGNSPVPLSSTKSKISSGRSSGSGKGVDGGGSTRTNAGAVGTDRTARSDDGVGDDSAGDSGGIKPPGARWAGSGERAYAVRRGEGRLCASKPCDVRVGVGSSVVQRGSVGKLADSMCLVS